MKLYNVYVRSHFRTSHDGTVNTSFRELVFAESEEEAIKFSNKSLEEWGFSNGKAESAIEVDSTKGQFLNKPQYYKPTEIKYHFTGRCGDPMVCLRGCSVYEGTCKHYLSKGTNLKLNKDSGLK
jgi:hypothetical protein